MRCVGLGWGNGKLKLVLQRASLHARRINRCFMWLEYRVTAGWERAYIENGGFLYNGEFVFYGLQGKKRHFAR